MEDVFSIFILIWIIISIFILSPYTVYIYFQFRKYSHLSYFHARRPKMMLIILINLIYYQIFHVPLYALFALFLYPDENDITYCTVTMSWFVTGFHSVILSFHIGYWLLAYDLMYNAQVSDMKWIQHLFTIINK